MKIRLTEQEMINIVASMNETDIKFYADGKYKKWNGQKNYDDNCSEYFDFEYKYDSKGNLKEAPNSPQQNKPTGFDSSSCLRREHNSRVIGTQNNSGEKSIVSPEDTIQSKHKAEINKDYMKEIKEALKEHKKCVKEDGGVK